MNLALFDFDGTITKRDTFKPFLKKFIPSSAKKHIGGTLLLPLFVGYKLGIFSSGLIRKQVISVGFKGLSYSKLQQAGLEHATNFLPDVICEQALAHIQSHRNNGDRIIVVSASLDVYLRHWCEQMDVELVCNRLEYQDDILTGNYIGKDCAGKGKVELVQDLLSLDGLGFDDYDTVYAYGDTKDDKAMLDIADEKFYRGKKVN